MSEASTLYGTKDFKSRHVLAVIGSLCSLLLVTWFIYQPALIGPFMLDDFDNLSALKGGVVDWASLTNYLANGNAGPLGRPISKLSFLLDDNAWLSSPENFKRTNLLIHILVGVLIFSSFRLLLSSLVDKKQSDWLALLVAAFFLVHPIQVSTAMYVVQRMTQLAGLFVMLGVFFHLYWRTKFEEIKPLQIVLMSISLGLCTLLAAFSKESGVLLPVFLLVIELTIFSNQKPSPLFYWWKCLFLVLPTISICVYLAYWPKWASSYAARDFTLLERLLTEPVILLDYIGSIISMRVGGLGLFHDDYPIYNSLLDPVAFGSLLVVIGAISCAFIYRKRAPLISFGVLWYFAGHLIEATTPALELYFEHRNYISLLGPIIVVFIIVYNGLQKVSLDVAKLSPFFAVIVFGIASMTTWGYASEWSSLKRIIPIWAVEHPDSPRAQRTYAQLLASMGLEDAALGVLDEAYQRFPHDLSIPVLSIDISCAFGGRQRFKFDELAQSVANHRLTDGLRPALKSLLERILETPCRDQSGDLHLFMKAIPEIEKGELSPSAIASLFKLDGDLYVREGDGNGALASYQIVHQLVPSIGSKLRIAGLYIMVKDYVNARLVLQLALDQERSSSLGVSEAKEREYAEKFELIDRLSAGG